MNQNIDDLEVSLIAYDRGKAAYGSFVKGMNDSSGAAEFLATTLQRSLVGAGAAAGAAFSKLVIDGKAVSLSIREMGKEIGATTREADALYSVIKDTNPSASVEDLSDAVLTLSERFTEGRVKSGELFNFVKDFGLEANFAVEGARAQTVEFLRILKQLPSETDRVSTAIAVMGDSGARQFNKMLRNVEDIDKAIEMWSGSIEDIPDIFTEEESKQLDEYSDSVAKLSKSYESLSETAFTLVIDELTDINNFLIKVLDKTEEYFDLLDSRGQSNMPTDLSSNFFGIGNIAEGYLATLAMLTGNNDLMPDSLRPPEIPVRPTNNPHPDVYTPSRRPDAAPVRFVNEYGSFENKEAFEKFYADMQRDIQAMRDTEPVALSFDPITNARHAFEDSLLNADGGRDKAAEQSQFFQTILEEEIRQIGILGEGFDSLSGSLADFSDMALTKGTKAFKVFQGLQFATATASAYSAAAQVLADWKSFSYAEKALAGAKVLSLGLGWAKKIKGISASGSSTNSSGPEQISDQSAPPQAERIDFDGGANGDVININVQGERVTVSDLQEMARRISEIPNQPFVTVTGN